MVADAEAVGARIVARTDVPSVGAFHPPIVLDGVPCRIRVPASCKEGAVIFVLVALLLLYGCFEPRFDSDSHKRNGDGRYGLSTVGGTGNLTRPEACL